jgi:uncharacterized protein (TIGR01777 family)
MRDDGHEIVAVSRGNRASLDGDAQVSWDRVADAVDGADAVVNLAGASIGTPRWTARRKDAIATSRVSTTRSFADAISAASQPPRVFVTASGVDIYGDSGDTVVDEHAPPGSSFLAGVCVEWEAAAEQAIARHVAVRTALVIGRDAPALRPIAAPFRLFLGGRLGDGRQYFPWIHITDLVAIYRKAISDATLAGPLNAVAPEVPRQRDAARTFGAVLGRPSSVPVPAVMLRLALGEQSDLLLHGQHAVSRRLDGFGFVYPHLHDALADALGR